MFNHASSTEATWHTLLCADHWTIVVVTRERTGRTTLSIHLASRTGFIDTCSEGKVAGKWKIGYFCCFFFACFPDCILWIEDPQVPHLAMHENHIPLTPPPKKKKKNKSKKVSLDVMQSHPLHRTHFRQSLESMQDSCYTCCSTITASTLESQRHAVWGTKW